MGVSRRALDMAWQLAARHAHRILRRLCSLFVDFYPAVVSVRLFVRRVFRLCSATAADMKRSKSGGPWIYIQCKAKTFVAERNKNTCLGIQCSILDFAEFRSPGANMLSFNFKETPKKSVET